MRSLKNVLTEQELGRLYIKEKLTTSQIANVFEVSQRSVRRWLKNCGIEIRVSNTGRTHTKETRMKMSERMMGKKNPMYGKVEVMRKRQLNGLLAQQNSKEPTSIEKKVYEALKAKGLLFETQKLINGKFIVDAYIPSLNLVIEVDGKYWHSLDRVMKKDKAENAYLKKCGFKLLRLSEMEIKNKTYIRKVGALN